MSRFVTGLAKLFPCWTGKAEYLVSLHLKQQSKLPRAYAGFFCGSLPFWIWSDVCICVLSSFIVSLLHWCQRRLIWVCELLVASLMCWALSCSLTYWHILLAGYSTTFIQCLWHKLLFLWVELEYIPLQDTDNIWSVLAQIDCFWTAWNQSSTDLSPYLKVVSK